MRSLLDAYGAWTKRHPILWDLVFSIMIGVLLEAAILYFQPPMLAIVRRAGDDTADKMIRLAEATTATLDGSPAFVFVDIDNATWQSWGAPLITPRDKLAGLIERIASYRPMLIIVDVDLSFPTGIPLAEADDPLRAMLAGYPADAPSLLLVRNFVSPDAATGALYPAPRPTAYDSVTANRGNIVWAAPRFEEDDDGKVRRWRLFEVTCDGGRPAVVPSMHLAASLIARSALFGRDPDEQPLSARLAPLVPRTCTEQPANPEAVTISDWPKGAPITIDDEDIRAQPPQRGVRGRAIEEDVRKRIIYRVRWQDGEVELGPIVRPPGIGPTPLVSVRPASVVFDLPVASAATAGSGSGFANRIVVISGSYADSGDWHRTPIGAMPGALLIVNAIEALVHGGTPREPGVVQRIAISLGIIFGVSLLVSVFRPIIAAWLSSIGILLVMLISLPGFKSGVVLDLAVPSVGIFVHDILASLSAAWRQFRQQGWRWFLRAHDDHIAHRRSKR
jgi:CHASE2 domain-containing sensor protein